MPLADFQKEAESSKPECWVWEARGHHLVLWLGNVLEMMVALNLFAGKVALFALVGRILEVGNDLAVSMGGASQKMAGCADAAGIELLGRVKETEPHQESLDQMLSRTERLGDYHLGGHHLVGVSLWVLTPGLLSSLDKPPQKNLVFSETPIKDRSIQTTVVIPQLKKKEPTTLNSKRVRTEEIRHRSFNPWKHQTTYH